MPKRSEGCNAREFKASKGWFGNFRKRFDQIKKKKIQRLEVASVDQQRTDNFQDNMRKLLRSKYICLDKFYNTDDSALFWEKVSCCCCCLVTKSCPIFSTPWTADHQAPLSMGLPRQKYWSELPFSSPGDLSHSWIKLTSSALAS